MFENLTLLSLAKGRMDWVAKRQEVLSENIANANTPKYMPSDVKPWNFREVLSQTVPSVQVKTTNINHVAPQIRDSTTIVTEKKVFETSPDGNGVVVEEQMAKLGQARTAYDMAAGLFEKQYKLLRTALKGQ